MPGCRNPGSLRPTYPHPLTGFYWVGQWRRQDVMRGRTILRENNYLRVTFCVILVVTDVPEYAKYTIGSVLYCEHEV